MNTKKISELDVASVVNNNDVLPIVQNGETKKVSTDTLIYSNINVICRNYNGTYQYTTSQDSVHTIIPLNNEIYFDGGAFTYNNDGTITINKNCVLEINAMASITYSDSNATYFNLEVYKNSNIIGSPAQQRQTNSGYAGTFAIPSVVTSVEQGDTISLRVFRRIAGATAVIYPQLTIKVIGYE